MEIYGEIIVHSDNETILSIANQIRKINNSSWKYLDNVSEKASLGGIDKILCLENIKEGIFFYLRESEQELLLFNIIPTGYQSLSKSQYNNFLDIFCEDILYNLINDHNIISIKKERHIAEVAGTNTFEALEKWFSESYDGLKVNSNDFRRWVHFLSVAQANNSDLDSETFRTWLIEEKKFTEEKAEEYSQDYDYGRQILQYLH